MTVAALIGVMTGAAVLLPWVMPRAGELPFSLRDVELLAGPRDIRTTLSLLVLLLLMLGGTIAGLAEGSPFANVAMFLDALLALLLISTALPGGRARRFALRLVELLCAGAAVHEVGAILIELWRAAADGSTLLVTRRWTSVFMVNASSDPLAFWYSIVGRAFILGILLYFLREYALRCLEQVRRRRIPHSARVAKPSEDLHRHRE